jgi:hypothetical protein
MRQVLHPLQKTQPEVDVCFVCIPGFWGWEERREWEGGHWACPPYLAAIRGMRNLFRFTFRQINESNLFEGLPNFVRRSGPALAEPRACIVAQRCPARRDCSADLQSAAAGKPLLAG